MLSIIDTCIAEVSGYVNNNLDCEDTNPDIYPGAIEVCNYLDDNCDGIEDDNVIFIQTYQDEDGDSFSNILIDSFACEIPFGYVVDNTDCDDTNANIYPGAVEILNGADDVCDQIADEGINLKDPLHINFSVYPNPTSYVLIVASNLSCIISYNIVLTYGSIVKNGFINTKIDSINVAELPSGFYVIELKSLTFTGSKGFIKE